MSFHWPFRNNICFGCLHSVKRPLTFWMRIRWRHVIKASYTFLWWCNNKNEPTYFHRMNPMACSCRKYYRGK